jgi:predicted nucleotidyltransferase
MATPDVFQVPPINKRKRIPMKTIRAIAEHIARKFDPEQIILFGSHAYGKPTAWSDVDLLVVMDTPQGKEFEKSKEKSFMNEVTGEWVTKAENDSSRWIPGV